MIKYIAIILLQISPFALLAQNKIKLNQQLTVISKEKVDSEIKKGAILRITGLKYFNVEGRLELVVTAKNSDSVRVNFPTKKIKDFDFLDIDNVGKLWDKHQLINGTYENLLSHDFQYSIRSNLNDEAIDYINLLQSNHLFFNDSYFEDYLFTLLNKIHNGFLNDQRPGNLYIKILKDPVPNAFSLPNGCIILTTGLLSTIQSEDELIGVLAHEVAHFVLDHQILNFNKMVDRKRRAEFWATFATVVSSISDVYLSVNSKNYIPGFLTTATAITACTISDEIVDRLGIKYNQEQEFEADNAAVDMLRLLKYDTLGLSVALQRIKNYCIISGNLLAISGGDTHPSFDNRISKLGQAENMNKFIQSSFLKKVSLVTSYNAWVEMWLHSNQAAANELVERNISNGVATESDFIVSAIVLRRFSNTKESNDKVLLLLNKAKMLNVTPFIIIEKEEGITLLRLNKVEEAKTAFKSYLVKLNDSFEKNNQIDDKNRHLYYDEVLWTKKMIFKIDKL
jgi:predicted Zn-dependent protease